MKLKVNTILEGFSGGIVRLASETEAAPLFPKICRPMAGFG
jgi:hypothetical protein